MSLSAAAFSLVELLIIIALIGLLLAILLPALAGARASGHAAVCASNLRQLQLAADAYANDHRDRHCPGAADALINLNRWHGTRTSANAPFTPAGGPLTPYLGGDAGSPGASPAIRACPAFNAAHAAATPPGFERSAGGYGYNNTFVGTDRAAAASSSASLPLWTITTDRLGAPRSRFADPAATVAFADAALATGEPAAAALGGIVEYSFIEPRFWPDFDPPARPDPTIHFRHFRARAQSAAAAGACWLDGHVTSERRTHSTSSSVYGINPSEFGVGWFGKNDDNSLFDYR